MAKSSQKLSVGVIGVGKMGEALIRGFGAAPSKVRIELCGSIRRPERTHQLSKELQIPVVSNNAEVVQKSDVIILSVKPHQAEDILRKIAPKLTKDHLLISICAAISLDQIKKWSGGKARILRAMPNLPSLIQQGMTVLTPSEFSQKADLDIAQTLFSGVGQTAILEESLLDGVTALSACGPAFVFLIIESLAEAGVKVGIPRDTSILLAAQTLKGSAQMVIDQKKHPAALKDEVTTPAGCTIDGLMALEDGKLRHTLIKAVVASTERSAAMRKAQ